MRPLALVVAAAAALACSPSRSDAAAAPAPACTFVEDGWGPPGQVPIRVERVATGLEVPWGLAFLPNGDVLVTERPGRIRLLRGGALVAEPVATVPVAEAGEGGLLGIAPDPRFAENRRFYLYATVEEGGRNVNQLSRWTLAADGRSATKEKVLLDGVAAESYHDGGRIRFGPDGLLYLGTGDAGKPDRAQDPGSPNGKVLRLTPDGAPAPGNPTPGSPVFLRGVRNVEAFDWLDPQTLVVADHGPSGELGGRRGADEITVARAGENLGWPAAWRCDAKEGMTAPVLSFKQAMPPGGASFYRGDLVPAWKGSFLVGTLGSRHLHRVVLEGGKLKLHEVYLQGDPPAGMGRIRDVEQGPDGALWVTTSNCDGRGTCPPEKDVVARIVAR